MPKIAIVDDSLRVINNLTDAVQKINQEIKIEAFRVDDPDDAEISRIIDFIVKGNFDLILLDE